MKELSTIDMYLRKFFISLTLDIEHVLKTQLMRDIAENVKESGYNVVQEFFNHYRKFFNRDIKNEIENKVKRGDPSFDLWNYHKDNLSVWHLIELLSFGEFITLYKKYYEIYSINNDVGKYLPTIKILRNAAAHNICLINNLYKEKDRSFKPIPDVTKYLSAVKVSKRQRQKKINNFVIHSFVVTLMVFYKFCDNEKIKEYQTKDLYLLLKRINYKKYLFQDNELLSSSFDFFKKVIDSLAKYH